MARTGLLSHRSQRCVLEWPFGRGSPGESVFADCNSPKSTFGHNSEHNVNVNSEIELCNRNITATLPPRARRTGYQWYKTRRHSVHTVTFTAVHDRTSPLSDVHDRTDGDSLLTGPEKYQASAWQYQSLFARPTFGAIASLFFGTAMRKVSRVRTPPRCPLPGMWGDVRCGPTPNPGPTRRGRGMWD